MHVSRALIQIVMMAARRVRGVVVPIVVVVMRIIFEQKRANEIHAKAKRCDSDAFLEVNA